MIFFLVPWFLSTRTWCRPSQIWVTDRSI